VTACAAMIACLLLTGCGVSYGPVVVDRYVGFQVTLGGDRGLAPQSVADDPTDEGD
jgi:hypothetical protein